MTVIQPKKSHKQLLNTIEKQGKGRTM